MLALLTAATIACVSATTIVAADSTAYVVLNHGRPAGEMTVLGHGDSVVVRYRHIDRNRGVRGEWRYHLAGGAVAGGSGQYTNLDGAPFGPATTFEQGRDSVRWSVGGKDAGDDARRGRIVRLNGPYDDARLATLLLARPDHSAPMAPEGTVRADVIDETTVPTPWGRTHLRLVAIRGKAYTPDKVWIDDRGALFASSVDWFITVRAGAESVLPLLRPIEVAYQRRIAEGLARSVPTMAKAAAATTPGVTAIVHGDVFDAEQGVVRRDQTVIVRGERIMAVGPADSVRAPADATVIDAKGKTIVPGLWDMHGHFALESSSQYGVMQLARGITTVRDLASDLDVATYIRDAAQAGRLLSPHVVLAGFIEGPGAWAGPTEVLVRTEAEARAWVARYDSLGYGQVKLYNLVHPDLVPAIADEAHRRGMRVSGHVVRGLSVADAVALGYDEINHAAFLFSTFYPDSLFVPRMRAYSLVASVVAANTDPDGAPMTSLIETLEAHRTVIDGTWAVWMQGNATGAAVSGATGADTSAARRSDEHYVRLLKRLYDAGVPLVPGTDSPSGNGYQAELALYERAGIPPAEVLRMATIGSARVMRADADYGTIAPGKVADLLIIDGKPAERIADMEKIEVVMRAGRAFTPKALREAIGVD
jgi:imidazolonepropionase-like amidohydrolase